MKALGWWDTDESNFYAAYEVEKWEMSRIYARVWLYRAGITIICELLCKYLSGVLSARY